MMASTHSSALLGLSLGGYPKMALMMSGCTFFFNKKIAWVSSHFALSLSTANSIMKSAMCFLPCLKVSILHSASAVWDRSSKSLVIAFSKISHPMGSSSLITRGSHFVANWPAVPPLKRARTAVALFTAVSILLNFMYNCIFLHQSSHLDLVPSKYPGSGTRDFPFMVIISFDILLFSDSGLELSLGGNA